MDEHRQTEEASVDPEDLLNSNEEDSEEMAENCNDTDQEVQETQNQLPNSFTYAEEGNDSDENIFRKYLEKNK